MGVFFICILTVWTSVRDPAFITDARFITRITVFAEHKLILHSCHRGTSSANINCFQLVYDTLLRRVTSILPKLGELWRTSGWDYILHRSLEVNKELWYTITTIYQQSRKREFPLCKGVSTTEQLIYLLTYLLLWFAVCLIASLTLYWLRHQGSTLV